MCVLADGFKITTPVAEVFINTPYLDERHALQCIEHPVYDVIIGNVLGTRHLVTPNLTISLQVNAVETRQWKTNEKKYFTLFKLSRKIVNECNISTDCPNWTRKVSKNSNI